MRAKEREHYELYTHKHFIKGKPKLIMFIIQHLKGKSRIQNFPFTCCTFIYLDCFGVSFLVLKILAVDMLAVCLIQWNQMAVSFWCSKQEQNKNILKLPVYRNPDPVTQGNPQTLLSELSLRIYFFSNKLYPPTISTCSWTHISTHIIQSSQLSQLTLQLSRGGCPLRIFHIRIFHYNTANYSKVCLQLIAHLSYKEQLLTKLSSPQLFKSFYYEATQSGKMLRLHQQLHTTPETAEPDETVKHSRC